MLIRRFTGVLLFSLALNLCPSPAISVDKHKVTFPVYWVEGDATKKYRIYGIPMILLIKNGEIVEKIPGQRSETFLEKNHESSRNGLTTGPYLGGSLFKCHHPCRRHRHLPLSKWTSGL